MDLYIWLWSNIDAQNLSLFFVFSIEIDENWECPDQDEALDSSDEEYLPPLTLRYVSLFCFGTVFVNGGNDGNPQKRNSTERSYH